jgi:hypothetical protein
VAVVSFELADGVAADRASARIALMHGAGEES